MELSAVPLDFFLLGTVAGNCVALAWLAYQADRADKAPKTARAMSAPKR